MDGLQSKTGRALNRVEAEATLSASRCSNTAPGRHSSAVAQYLAHASYMTKGDSFDRILSNEVNKRGRASGKAKRGGLHQGEF